MDWSEVFSYKNGVLYWKVKSCRRNDVNVGDVAGSLCKKRLLVRHVWQP